MDQAKRIKDSQELVGWLRQAVPGQRDPQVLATVKSLSPLQVAFDGEIDENGLPITTPVAMSRVHSYTPVLGDRVLMMRTGKTYTMLGSIGDPADLRWHYVGMPGEPALTNATPYEPASTNYAWPRFRKDPEGCVWLEGLLTGLTAGTVLFTLPPGYRPANTLMIGVEGAGSGCQIQISSAGVVSFQNAQVAPGHMSLDNISFMAEDYNPPPWTPLTLANGWANLAGFNPAQVYVDSCGDAHFSGVVAGGSVANIATGLPAGSYQTDSSHMHTAWSNAGTARFDVTVAGNIQLIGYGTGGSNASVSLDGLVISNVGGYWGAKVDYAGTWVAFGSGWVAPGLTINKNGIASMRGMVKLGAAGAILTAGLSPLFAPTHQKIFLAGANANKSCRVDIGSAAGATPSIIQEIALFDGGTNGYVSLDTMRWNTQFAK